MTESLITLNSSPFEGIKQTELRREYWSARDLQKLMDYTEWRKFEDAIERAMIACKNSGQAPSDHFVSAANMIATGKGAQRRVEDYHLSRYACYLVAMNSDPRKEAVSQAQTYFAIKTREAEVIQQALPVPTIHTLTDALRPRALENLNSVPEGYFSVMGELFKHLYNLEAIINQAIDNKAMIEISVGQHWSQYTRDVLNLSDQQRHKYRHQCQDGRIVQAWAYPIQYVNTFAKWLWTDYFPKSFPAYQHYRARHVALVASKSQQKLIS